MKKIIILFVTTALISIATISKAQDEQCFKKGTSAINLGVGFGNTIAYGTGLYGYGTGISISPAFTASYEYGIIHVGIGTIGAGLEFGYQGSHYNYTDGVNIYKERWTTLAFGPRATYHFDFLNKKKFDVYPIIQVNIYSSLYSDNGPAGGTYLNPNTNSVSVRPSVLVAARYFFTPNIGVYSELGYDISIIKAGLSIKFGGS
ncbi:MAG TPA: hypothetical protein VNX01_10350 [Bacteroidia bacterium]|nr:hypothetical protein [Bacteroidia bacterium]